MPFLRRILGVQAVGHIVMLQCAPKHIQGIGAPAVSPLQTHLGFRV